MFLFAHHTSRICKLLASFCRYIRNSPKSLRPVPQAAVWTLANNVNEIQNTQKSTRKNVLLCSRDRGHMQSHIWHSIDIKAANQLLYAYLLQPSELELPSRTSFFLHGGLFQLSSVNFHPLYTTQRRQKIRQDGGQFCHVALVEPIASSDLV